MRASARPAAERARREPESAGAASFHRALAAVEAAPDVRFERVFVLRAALRSGTYRPAAREVAASMLAPAMPAPGAPSSRARRRR